MQVFLDNSEAAIKQIIFRYLYQVFKEMKHEH